MSPLARLRRFRRDRRGASAIEFAIIAPMMIIVFMGLVETGNVVVAGRRTQHAANALGDLTAQQNTMYTSDVNDTFAAARAMVAPLPTTSLKLKVTCVTQDDKGKPIVQWSDVDGLTQDPKGSTYVGVPAGLLANQGDTVVISTAQYTLVQASKAVITSDIAFAKTAFVKPRYGTVTRDYTH